MHLKLEELIRLQAVDDQIEEMKGVIGRIPGQIETEKGYLAEFEAKAEELKAAFEEARKKQRDAEGEIQSIDQQLRDTRGKQALVKTNEEYRALTQEIEAFESNISSLEDSVLQIMDALPGYEERLSGANGESEAASAKVQSIIKKLGDDRARCEHEMEKLQRERERVVSSVDKEWLALYERARRSRGGLAVCPIVEQTCQGCRMSETLQRFIEIRDSEEKIFTCSNCGRIIYYQDAETTVAQADPQE